MDIKSTALTVCNSPLKRETVIFAWWQESWKKLSRRFLNFKCNTMKRAEIFFEAYPLPPPDSQSGIPFFLSSFPMAGSTELESILMKFDMNINFNFFDR